MSVSDTDIELLEAHLDGELSSKEDSILRLRLSSDHDLAMELVALRADRAIRAEVFESCEPNDLAVKNLLLSVRKQITKDAVWGDRLRILRYIGSAAAVIMISFTAGWLGKGRAANPNQDSQPVAVAQHDQTGSINFTGNPAGDPPGGPAVNGAVNTLVGNSQRPQFNNPANNLAAQNNPSGGFQVNLTDPFGHVLAVQHFNTLDEARQFSEDLGQFEKQQQQQQNRGTEFVDYPVEHRGQF
jgi:hypothetical protein